MKRAERTEAGMGKKVVALAALCGAVGCASSPPMHYYTLSSVQAPARLNTR